MLKSGGVIMAALALLGAGCSTSNTCTNAGARPLGAWAGGGGGSEEGGSGGGGSAPSTGTRTCGFTPECDPGADPAAGKAACDDGDVSTADRCVPTPNDCGGVCAHLLVECDHLDGPEQWAERCNDGDKCTVDRCGIKNTCEHDPAPGC